MNNITPEELEIFAHKCHNALTTEARDYLHSRGITDESIERFHLGFGRVYGTTWITIPAYDDSGQIHYIKLRHFPEDAICEYDRPVSKYSNYPSGCDTILFNEAGIKDSEDILIVEGEFDAIIASQYNLPPAVALPAADVFKSEWVEKLKHAKTICTWLDNDEVGQKGQESLIEKLAESYPNTTILAAPTFDGVKDATEFFISGHSEQEILQQAKHIAGPPLLSDSDVAEMSIDDLANILDSTIKYDRQNKCILFLAMLSAYTEQDQLNICLLGQSSSGKTYLAQEVSKYFPVADVQEYAEVSPTAFKHMGSAVDEKTNEIHVDCERKIMMFTEMPDPKLLANLRPLLSHDKKEIEFLTTDKNRSGSNLAKKSIIRGFPTVIFCSAYTKLDEQEITRCLLLSPEIGNQKVEAGVDLAGEKLANLAQYKEKMATNPMRESLKRRVRYIKNLNVHSVIIPKASKVVERFKASMPKNMPPHCQRDIAHVFSLIKAIAMLNAHNRMDADNNIIVTDQDVENGFTLWETISETQNLGVPPSVYDFYNRYIVPAYECRRESIKVSGELVADDGITLQDILAFYYEITGSIYNADALRKQIIPPLQTANMIQTNNSTQDGRKKIIKPIYNVQ